jgi:hypothetical protein
MSLGVRFFGTLAVWASCRVRIDQTHVRNHASVLGANMRDKNLLCVSVSGQKPPKWTKMGRDRLRVELDIALPNRPHREMLRGWDGPYLAGFQRIAAIDKQTKYITGHSRSHKAKA